MHHRKFISAILTGLLGTVMLHAAEWHVNAAAAPGAADGSAAAPFRRIGDALRKAVHGDTVTVADGTYRESVRIFRRQGETTLKIQAAAGARPVISGFEKITGWEKSDGGLYRATIAYKPTALLRNRQYMPLARIPETGWLPVKRTGDFAFTAQPESPIPAGAGCYLWTRHGNVFWNAAIEQADGGAFTVAAPKAMKLQDNDRCFFYNHRALIRRNGQWAWRATGGKYELSIRLDDPADLDRIEVAGKYNPVEIQESSNIEISGFDLTGGARYGLMAMKSSALTLTRLGCYWNADTGVMLRDCTRSELAQSRMTGNLFGLVVFGGEAVTVRQCDIGYNFEDGVNICWNARNVVLDGNFVHNHVWWGHPDQIQLFRNVRDVTLRNNLLLGSLQGIMTEQAEGLKIENNFIAGVGGNLVILGHKNVNRAELRGNTLLAPGFASVFASGRDYLFSANIFEGGRSCYAVYGHGGQSGYKGSGNLFLTREKGSVPAMFDGKVHRDFDAYAKLAETGSARSSAALPGTPVSAAVIDDAQIVHCTPGTIHLRGGSDGFAVNNFIEINFDGVPRTVTAIEGRKLSFAPPLDAKPLQTYPVLNWGASDSFQWQPRPDFPIAAGAALNPEAMRRDARAIVPMPPEVQAFTAAIDRLIPPKDRR